MVVSKNISAYLLKKLIKGILKMWMEFFDSEVF